LRVSSHPPLCRQCDSGRPKCERAVITVTKPKSSQVLLSEGGQGVRFRTEQDGSSNDAILLIEDNGDVARAITLACACAGYHVETATCPDEGFSMLARRRYGAVLLDLNFSPGHTSGAEGFACLTRIIADDPAAAVVIITAHSGIRIAVAAMQAGAIDFVMKPWRNADLIGRLEAAIARQRRQIDAAPLAPPPTIRGLLGSSPPIVALRDLIRRVAPTAASVIISGPEGSGRSLAATMVHEGSPYADEPPVIVDLRDDAAWERLKNGTGTIILRYPDKREEIAQARLLDRLPPGARLISIVNRPSQLIVPLRTRLGTIELELPPLAARGQDALVLARHFAAVAAGRYGKDLPQFTASAEELVLSTHWPDDVRGLALAIERAVLLDDTGVIDSAALKPTLVEKLRAVAPDPAVPLDVSLQDSERVIIEAALRRHHHNVSHAAAAIGISRQALYRRMTRYGL
jgi:DNA-binding NtrC family response regulator